MKSVIFVAGIVLAIGACSETGDSGATTTTNLEVDADATTTIAEGRPTTTTEVEAASSESVLTIGSRIELLTPPSGNVSVPVLSWVPVDGATSYTTIVYDQEGLTWWAWSGVESEVVLGGVAESTSGPRAGPGVTWVVLAYDGDSLIGTSARQALED